MIRRAAPNSVKTICVILVAAPLLEGTTRYVQAPWHYNSLTIWLWLISFALSVCVAAGLAKGFNWLRWIFAVVAGLGLFAEFISATTIGPILIGAPPPLPLGIGLAVWMANMTAVVLCFAPTADRHFRPKRRENDQAL